MPASKMEVYENDKDNAKKKRKNECKKKKRRRKAMGFWKTIRPAVYAEFPDNTGRITTAQEKKKKNHPLP